MGKFFSMAMPMMMSLSNYWTDDLLISYTGYFVQDNCIYGYDHKGEVFVVVTRSTNEEAYLALEQLEKIGKIA